VIEEATAVIRYF